MNGKSPKPLPLSRDARMMAITKLVVRVFHKLINQPFTSGRSGFSTEEIRYFQKLLNEVIDNYLDSARIEVDYQVKNDEQ